MFTRTSRRLLTAGGSAALLLTLVSPSGSAAAGAHSAGHWKHSHAAVANGLQCPTTKLCVGVDGNKVAWTTKPTASKPHWKRVALEPGTQPGVQGGVILTALSCPSAHFCVATDDLGNTFSTTHPTGGKSAWHKAVADSIEMLAVSCSSPSLCAAIDYYGNALTSTNPGGAAPGWHSVPLGEAPDNFESVSCAGASLCVAVLDTKNIYTTTNPGGAAPKWKKAKAGNHIWDAISCPSTSKCVAVGQYDTDSRVAVSSHPAGGSRSWKTSPVHNKNFVGLSKVDCATKSFCFALADVFSTHPAAKKSAWHSTTPPTNGSETALSCPTAKWCFVGTSVGEFLSWKR